ncbi:quinone oxidoreductase [Pyrenophora seminiperda CCB06]|uniref:Quinone oxidoreductase n=1 Tax=Pyrenophora seminiperda CCB06 TaxID=1302712 RepID=A0A3M7MCI0_9PLEO|nr:quinone oxidoreductase [Pyrenophora seminiperda CCB06]
MVGPLPYPSILRVNYKATPSSTQATQAAMKCFISILMALLWAVMIAAECPASPASTIITRTAPTAAAAAAAAAAASIAAAASVSAASSAATAAVSASVSAVFAAASAAFAAVAASAAASAASAAVSAATHAAASPDLTMDIPMPSPTSLLDLIGNEFNITHDELIKLLTIPMPPDGPLERPRQEVPIANYFILAFLLLYTAFVVGSIEYHWWVNYPKYLRPNQLFDPRRIASNMEAILIDKFVTNLTDVRPLTVPKAACKSPEDLRIKITHAAVTHVDVLYVQGLHQNNRRHVQPPFIPGTEFAGHVISSSANSTFQPGTRVFGGGLGAYAEQICVPEESVRRVPEQWTNAEACAIGVSGAVSYGALLDVATLKSGEAVLVLGASGGLGVMAVQIAKAVGARVIAVVGDEEKAEMVRKIGADAVVNYHDERWEDGVKELTERGEGVDVVYDGIGAVESGVRCLKYRGRLVIVGFAARNGNVENIRANRILLKSVAVLGYRFGEDGRRNPQRTKDVWTGFMKLVEAGKIQPVVYKEDYRGLQGVRKALEDVKERKTWGRAVVSICEDVEVSHGQRSRL